MTPDGKNKLVPSISFTLTNTGQTTWGTMEINCVFRRVGDPEEWSTVLLMGARAGLNGLAPGGRLLLPLTVGLPGMGALGKGVVVVIARTADGTGFSAEVLSFVAIYSAIGLRDHGIEACLGQALRRTSFPNLTQLRRDPHGSSPDCWLHAERFCLSMARTSA